MLKEKTFIKRKESPKISSHSKVSQQSRKLAKVEKMAKTRNRIKKMHFQKQHRNTELEPLSQDDKYIETLSRYCYRNIGRTFNEKIQRNITPQFT